MKDLQYELFIKSTALSVLVAAAISGVFNDLFHVVALIMGGLYILLSTWTYKLICLGILKEGTSKRKMYFLILPLKLLLFFTIIYAVLNSSLGPYLKDMFLGVLMFIPGSLITACIAPKLSSDGGKPKE
ncbi:MAG: hypothetical protein GYA55_13770 [SAR324 cluster bacterium]|uniref:Uncharacterized protein n=1 Tax=SAR324 cluster bacterium TaxID=2024889 RepID=A0A7X9ILG8_9DELT|nr:hypothetical protein [SAR324 cluster bacterium]